MKKILYLFSFLFSFALGANLEEAIAEYNKKNYKVSAFYFRQLANQKNADALFRLASMYRYGEGVKKDNKQSMLLYKEAISAYQKLVRNVNGEAEFYLALMYEQAWGTSKDCSKAIAFYKKSANKNYLDAQNNLGLIYKDGKCGIKEDRKKAYKYLNLAAQTGDFIAKINLDILCRESPIICKK